MISFTRKKYLLLEEKAVQFLPCLLNAACLFNRDLRVKPKVEGQWFGSFLLDGTKLKIPSGIIQGLLTSIIDLQWYNWSWLFFANLAIQNFYFWRSQQTALFEGSHTNFCISRIKSFFSLWLELKKTLSRSPLVYGQILSAIHSWIGLHISRLF